MDSEIIQKIRDCSFSLQTILAVFLTAGFFIVLLMVMVVKQDPNDHDVLNILMGVLGTSFVQVINFYFGSCSKEHK
jgi:hypothetical protein